MLNAYRVSLTSPKFHSSKKWSVRMREVFRQHGKTWDDRVERDVKQRVAEAVAMDPRLALLAARRSAFDALAAALEQRLQEAETRRATA
jgi:hypothetical protein